MDAERKGKLGARWSCYSCGAKFYDLGKPEPLCPRCQADQRQSPAFEQPKAKRSRPAKPAKPAKKKAPPRPPPEPHPALPLESDADTEIDFEDVELIGGEGIGLDATDDDDEPAANGADEVDLD